jgi:hypothetical protein
MLTREDRFADVEHRTDVRMAEGREHLRLALEALPDLGVVRDVVRENLDGDRAVEAGVARFVDLAHTARAQRGKDFIRPEVCPGGQCHERAPARLHNVVGCRRDYNLMGHSAVAGCETHALRAGAAIGSCPGRPLKGRTAGPV